jgi:hypothetical protein
MRPMSDKPWWDAYNIGNAVTQATADKMVFPGCSIADWRADPGPPVLDDWDKSDMDQWRAVPSRPSSIREFQCAVSEKDSRVLRGLASLEDLFVRTRYGDTWTFSRGSQSIMVDPGCCIEIAGRAIDIDIVFHDPTSPTANQYLFGAGDIIEYVGSPPVVGPAGQTFVVNVQDVRTAAVYATSAVGRDWLHCALVHLA